MQTISREVLNYTLSPMNPPVARVRPGETFRIETELNTGAWLKTPEDRLQPDTIKFPYVNAASGPVWVEGARPGDMLVVHIEAIEVADLGYTAIKPGITAFPDWIRRREWGLHTHVGDVHAVQGDGEVCGAGGIETRSVCTLRVEVRPRPAVMTWPRIETLDHLVTIGCARPAEDAFRIAAQEMTAWLEADYSFAQEEAVMLLGQTLEARCTQFVNPKYTYVCKVAKRYLPA